MSYFNYRGHRYTVIFKTKGRGKDAKEAISDLKKHTKRWGGKPVYTAIKKSSDNRYTLGVREK